MTSPPDPGHNATEAEESASDRGPCETDLQSDAIVATGEAQTAAADPTCWICLGGTQENDVNGPMIQPCSCRGSQRLCHSKCIEAWLKVRLGAGAGGAAPVQRTWLAQIFRYNNGVGRLGEARGLERLINDIRQRELKAPGELRSLKCNLCGRHYAIKAKSLKDLSWKQWRGILLPTLGMVLAVLPLFLKMYTRYLQMKLSLQVSNLERVPRQDEAPGTEVFWSSFGTPSRWSLMVGFYACIMILRIGAKVYGMMGNLWDHLQSVQAESLVVVEGHQHQD